MKKITTLLFLTILLSFASTVYAAAPGKVENNTIIYGGHTYQLFDTTANWDAAEMYCEYLGGHLATVTKSGEERAIEKLLKVGKKYRYWLGAKRNANGIFDKWITGEKIKYTNWTSGNPDNSRGRENAIEIVSERAPDRNYWNKWNDLPENGGYDESDSTLGYLGFICEWDEILYTIQYNLNGGRQALNQIYTYDGTKKIKLRDARRSGYTFLGWYTDKYYTTKISTIPVGSKKNYILYARWKKTSTQ